MTQTLVSYLAAMVGFVLVDSIWLLTAGPSVLRMTERIQGGPVSFRIGPAVLVYVALAYLVLQIKTLTQAVLTGVATYAVYDMTNYALLKKYSPVVAVADTVWGGVLFGAVWSGLKWFRLS
jgi:uncharacterized membrane protein